MNRDIQCACWAGSPLQGLPTSPCPWAHSHPLVLRKGTQRWVRHPPPVLSPPPRCLPWWHACWVHRPGRLLPFPRLFQKCTRPTLPGSQVVSPRHPARHCRPFAPPLPQQRSFWAPVLTPPVVWTGTCQVLGHRRPNNVFLINLKIKLHPAFPPHQPAQVPMWGRNQHLLTTYFRVSPRVSSTRRLWANAYTSTPTLLWFSGFSREGSQVDTEKQGQVVDPPPPPLTLLMVLFSAWPHS